MLLLHPWTPRGSESKQRHFRRRKFTINKNRAFTTSATPKVKKTKAREGVPLLKQTAGMLVQNKNLSPKGDQPKRGSGFI